LSAWKRRAGRRGRCLESTYQRLKEKKKALWCRAQGVGFVDKKEQWGGERSFQGKVEKEKTEATHDRETMPSPSGGKGKMSKKPFNVIL